MEPFTEKEVRDDYYPQASDQTLETLPAFLDELMNGRRHDYGSICCALAAGATATANAMNHHKQGGISGFQAGAVMWEFIRAWNYSHNKCGLRLIDYDNMLYAQYEDKYTNRTIRQSNFDALQKEATKLLDDDATAKAKYDKDKAQYEIDIAAFRLKYPDYDDRPEHYKHLDGGTGPEWDAYHKKEKSGFNFAPREPHYHAGQIEHWQSIVDGVVPFGYKIGDD